MTIPDDLTKALLHADPQDGPFFAVLDGAQFEDLPRALLLGDFVARPLYLDRGDNDPERLATAPQLLWLDEREVRQTGRPPEAVITALTALLEHRPAAVFWACPGGGEVLYKHLRGLNLVMIPKAAAGMAATDPPVDDTHAPVTFRHADANVMAQTLPAVDAPEAARVFGPARRIVFAPEPDWLPNGAKPPLQFARNPAWPAPPPGLLRLSAATMARIEGLREQRSQRRIARYLRKVAPEQTQAMPEASLLASVALYSAEARTHGLRAEAARGRWCYLQLITAGAMGQRPEVTDFLSGKTPGLPPGQPDDRVQVVMQMAAAKAEEIGR